MKPFNSLQLVIFDLAGTTVKDDGTVPAVFSRTLQSFGVHCDPNDIDQFRGASKREVIRKLAPTNTDEIYKTFCSNLEEEFSTKGVSEIDGTFNTFLQLTEQGFLIALNTGFDRQITELILMRTGWDQSLFRAIVCADDVLQGRPAPDLIWRAMQNSSVESASRVANVGDTALDLQAGWNAGVRLNIGVLTGAHSIQKLSLEPHTHLIPSVRELPNYLF